MIVLVGESASGKSSVERDLLKFGYKKLVTYTTRPPRNAERDGVDYHFVTEEKFQKMILNGEFCEHAQYNGWQYGCAAKDCTDDKVAVLTPHGLRQIRKKAEIQVVSFYLKVDRRERLIRILRRGDDIEEAYRRSLSDVGQFDGIEDEVDYTIDNYGYEKSPARLAYIIKEKVNGNEEQKRKH